MTKLVGVHKIDEVRVVNGETHLFLEGVLQLMIPKGFTGDEGVNINEKDFDFLINALNKYRHAYLGARTLSDEPFENSEWKYFDKVYEVLIKNDLPMKSQDNWSDGE